MTIVGAGGVIIRHSAPKESFKKDRRKLTPEMRKRVDEKLEQLLMNPRPPGLKFEKLKGYKKPDIYSVHVTGNVKISFEINGDEAVLRRVAEHDEIKRAP